MRKASGECVFVCVYACGWVVECVCVCMWRGGNVYSKMHKLMVSAFVCVMYGWVGECVFVARWKYCRLVVLQ